MRIYKTRADFTKLNSAGNPSIFAGTVCTITDETANPMYVFQGGTWDSLVTATTDPVTGGIEYSVGEAFRHRLRRLAFSASIQNPLILPPLSGAGAWAANTAYAKGVVVTAGGYLYVCNIAGTSAASGGPSGSGDAPIVDNTCTWLFCGRNNPSTASPLCPTLATQTTVPGGLTNLYGVPAKASAFKFFGGEPTILSGDRYGFPAVALADTSLGNAAPHANNVTYRIAFRTDAAKIALGFSAVTNTTRVLVNGQYVKDSATVLAGSTDPNFLIIDFSASGGRQPRDIIVETGGGQPNAGNGFKGTYFFGAYVGSADTIWSPQNIDTVRAYFFGSSIEAGGPGTSNGPLYPTILGADWPNLMGKLLGWDDVWNGGVGGSGFLSDTGGTAKTWRAHASDAINAKAHIVFAFSNPNDNSKAAADITSEVLLFLQTIRAGLPNSLIVIGGNCAGSGGPSAATLANEHAVAAAVTAFNDANTFFIPWATDTDGSWFSGTGKVTATTGTGNADAYIGADGVHQTDAGHRYIAWRMAAKFKSVVLKMVS